MRKSSDFLNNILDSMTAHIVVIDSTGVIQFVNKSWTLFGDTNSYQSPGNWLGVNYLKECEKAFAMGDKFGQIAADGIRSVINKEAEMFYFEYPCHSPEKERWFMMRVTAFELDSSNFFVISHQNITERKIAEEEVEKLSRIDGLTNIPNRRAFDEFLEEEWKRCLRLKKPISLAILDLDHFKLLNDSYGHQKGDECLIKVGNLLKEYSNRPGDICSRYGGEEFAIIWGDTTLSQGRSLSNELLKRVESLKICNKDSPIGGYLTASIGLSSMIPQKNVSTDKLIQIADFNLYEAKGKGRNQVFG